MASDPLAIATTVLPESTFDPVQFAKERRQEVLTEQKDRRERYNKAWESVGTPTEMNRNVQQELMDLRNQIFEEGTTKSAEGIDLTDISHPKYGKDAMDFNNKLKQLDMQIDQTIALDKYLGVLRDTIAKDDKGVIDLDATNKNIATLKGLKNMDEINQFMSSKGDNLLVVKEPQFDMDKYIFDYLKDTGVKGIPKSYTEKKGGFLVTNEYNDISPEELTNAFTGMLSDPKFKAKVKKMREEDASDLRGGSDLEYLMERKGNRLTRQQTSFASKPYEPPKSDKPEEEKVEPTTMLTEPSKITISYTGKTSSGGETTGSYDSAGMNPIIYNKPVPVRVLPGSNSIDVETGKPIDIEGGPLKGSVLFTPIKSTEEYVSTVPTKRPNGTEWPAGTILPDGNYSKNKNVVKKRFVLGTYPKGTSGTATILAPYDNIKTELNSKNKVDESAISGTKNEVALSTEDQQAYDWANKNPNDPRAKQILKLLNKK